ncbi:MAG: hypothetical protein PHS99_04100 [Candidatus Marinimicrobia bacterium]|nr:hypothetical protein [Candidatus Neomarinimicrobiota bacterium]
MDESSRKASRNFLLLGIFGVAMGFLEAVVVVYLRQLYYPEGFLFPLKMMPSDILSAELIRELSTLVMLVVIGILAGKNFLQKFSYFLYTFAMWDIFYYVALKLFLNWPSSFLTWDILFLIPVTWVGPVLAPILCSLTMIFLAISVVFLQEKGYDAKFKVYEWIMILLGAFIIFYTFIYDYSKIIIQGGFLSRFWDLAKDDHFWHIISYYKPTSFQWLLFLVGEALIVLAIILMIKRTRLSKKSLTEKT